MPGKRINPRYKPNDVKPDKRICPKCNTEYPLTEEFFNKSKGKLFGLSCTCKNCINTYARSNYELRKEKEQEKRKKKREQRLKDDPDFFKKEYKKYAHSYKKYAGSLRENPFSRLKLCWHSAKNRAKETGKDFDIELQEVIDLYEQAGGCCSVSGIKFQIEEVEERYKKYSRFPFSPSIDRIDNTKGYIKGNIRLVSLIVNIAFNEWGEEPFKKMVVGYLEKNMV